MGLSDTLKSWGKPLVEDVAKELGAKCTFDYLSIGISLMHGNLLENHVEATKTNETPLDAGPSGPWDAFHVTDGRVITGTNPASAMETADVVIEVFEKL